MPKSLLETIRDLPDQPGVYHYFDANDRLLYIGKAKSLKKRVKSYFSFTPTLSGAHNLSPRIAKMIAEAVRLEYLIVESEHDALILENALIKQLRPKYNILLRDDKTYPYIYIDLSQPFPRFEITRKVVEGKNIKYYGPFSTGAKDILDSLYELFPLVQKASCLKGKKRCLFYQIKRCLAPCEGLVTQEEYAKIVQEAMQLLYKKTQLIKKLEEKMFHYAQELLFEEAQRIKERIIRIQQSQTVTPIDLANLSEYDLFAVAIKDQKACVVKIFIREGRIVSSAHSIFRSDTGFDQDELYLRILLDHYQKSALGAKEILLYDRFDEQESVEKLLSERFGKRVKISTPQRGEKRNVVKLAYTNALEHLKNDQEDGTYGLLKELKTMLNLHTIPYTIEGYDNSHLQGEATVGAMIKWQNGFIKNGYRRYHLQAKDEYAQMREMLTRRIERFDEQSPPDLMVIDGGATLLKLAKKIVKESGANVDIVAIAKEKRDFKANRSKGKAHDIIYFDEVSLKLSPDDKRLQFLQRIRDESHRFAISFHRKQKRKEDQAVSLLAKKGVGHATVRKLLNYFESFENIENASFEELKEVVGFKLAQTLKSS